MPMKNVIEWPTGDMWAATIMRRHQVAHEEQCGFHITIVNIYLYPPIEIALDPSGRADCSLFAAL
eukprot:scaffold1726_cov103-Skeletonema_dohrnii-CCMP3373.AAC.3